MSGRLAFGENELPAGGTIQMNAAAAANEIVVKLVAPADTSTPGAGIVFQTNTPPDNVYNSGWNCKGALDPTKPYACYTIEEEFPTFGPGTHCFEAYLEFAGANATHISRPWFAQYDKNSGDLTLTLECSGIGSVGILDVGASHTIAGFTFASIDLSGQSINVGADASTNTTNMRGSAAGSHGRILGGVELDRLSIAAGNGQFTVGATIPFYGFLGNVAGQSVYIQCANIGQIDAGARTLLSNGGVIVFETQPNKIAFFAGTPVTKRTVTGSKGANAALTSLMAALGDSGYNLVHDTTT